MFDSDRAVLSASAQCISELAALASEGAKMDREHRTRRLAYELWEQAGRPEGRANAFWDRAEEILGYK